MIPKTGGKRRRLGIPTMADRVVQASLKLVLEPIFAADFHPCSCGFRPQRRAHDAVAEVHYFASRPRSYERYARRVSLHQKEIDVAESAAASSGSTEWRDVQFCELAAGEGTCGPKLSLAQVGDEPASRHTSIDSAASAALSRLRVGIKGRPSEQAVGQPSEAASMR